MRAVCTICPRKCAPEEGRRGYCGARVNQGGKIICENYGRVTSMALDPIEKKPLRRFFPGSTILSVGSYGCNMDCAYCQNSGISKVGADGVDWQEISPEALVETALAYRKQGNIGLAFTYNEPLIGYEYVLDCAKLAKRNDLKVVLVTNGMILPEPWERLLPFVDAANIDLKAFSDQGYRELGGDFSTVCDAIARAAGRIHLEVTTLVVPGFNDSEEQMRAEADWLAALSDTIPLHLSRFFPRHRMASAEPTPPETIYRLADVAREKLAFVYTGNL